MTQIVNSYAQRLSNAGHLQRIVNSRKCPRAPEITGEEIVKQVKMFAALNGCYMKLGNVHRDVKLEVIGYLSILEKTITPWSCSRGILKGKFHFHKEMARRGKKLPVNFSMAQIKCIREDAKKTSEKLESGIYPLKPNPRHYPVKKKEVVVKAEFNDKYKQMTDEEFFS